VERSFPPARIVAALLGSTVVKLGVRDPSSGRLIEYLIDGFGSGRLVGIASWLGCFAAIVIVCSIAAVAFGRYASDLFIGDDAAVGWDNAFTTATVVALLAINVVVRAWSIGPSLWRDVTLADHWALDVGAGAHLNKRAVRGFLMGRGWRVPYLGPFFAIAEATRELSPGGPTAVLQLQDELDERGRVVVVVVGLWFRSVLGEILDAQAPAAGARLRSGQRRARRRRRRYVIAATSSAGRAGRHRRGGGTSSRREPSSGRFRRVAVARRQAAGRPDCADAVTPAATGHLLRELESGSCPSRGPR
jgi:hypothetical protein